jgi:hypothetical protein
MIFKIFKMFDLEVLFFRQSSVDCLWSLIYCYYLKLISVDRTAILNHISENTDLLKALLRLIEVITVKTS